VAPVLARGGPSRRLLPPPQLLLGLSASGDVEKTPDAATDTAFSILERADVAEQFAGGAAVRPHDVHLEIANLNASAGPLHRQLVRRHFLATPEDSELVGPA